MNTAVIEPVMTENVGAASAEPVARRALRVLPIPRKSTSLRSLEDVRVEMSRIYRDMRRRKIDTQDGTRLTYVLAQVGRVIEADKLGGRVEAIERVLRQRSAA